MVASWFAWRFGDLVGSPALYTATIPSDDVLLYSQDRDEEEFVVSLSKSICPQQIPLPDKGRVEAWHEARCRARERELIKGMRRTEVMSTKDQACVSEED